MELKKVEPIMPMMPEMFANAMPAQVPQMQWETGFFKDWMHNWKLCRIEEASEREARIAENKMRLINATLTMMQNLMTFSAETELRFKRIEHEKTMMTVEEQRGIAETTLIQNEAKLSEVELKIKMKELEEILGGHSQT